MPNQRFLGFALAVALVAVSLASPVRAPAAMTAADSRKPAPDFTLTDSKGAPVRLSGYQGRVVLLDFWATWCGGCKVEIPWYMEFQNKYKDRGLVVIGVSMDEDGWKSVRPFLEEHKLNYSVVIGSQDVARLYGGVSSMPMTLLIDRQGKIADSQVGMVDKRAFEGEIQALLQAGAHQAAK
jgi:peroxiredoxin